MFGIKKKNIANINYIAAEYISPVSKTAKKNTFSWIKVQYSNTVIVFRLESYLKVNSLLVFAFVISKTHIHKKLFELKLDVSYGI